MVYYFTSNVVNPPAIIYMGLDKYENESLIRFGFPEDVWFHVEKLSSAHVYLRLPKDKSINDIEPALLEDCAQLVKSNSIMGSKKNNIDVIYTKWSNLRKGADMDVGQIGFYNEKEVKKIRVERKNNLILNRLNKTKVEKFPCLEAEREERDRLERSENKMQIRATKEKEKEDAAKREEEKLLKSYASLMISDKMQSNQDDGEDSDDFM